MAIVRNTPAVVSQLTANYFELSYYQVINLPAGQRLVINHNAFNLTGEGDGQVKQLVRNMDEITVTAAGTFNRRVDAETPLEGGKTLDQIVEDGYDRADAYVAQGVPRALAYKAGQRDAIYALLEAVGEIPL